VSFLLGPRYSGVWIHKISGDGINSTGHSDKEGVHPHPFVSVNLPIACGERPVFSDLCCGLLVRKW